MKVGLSATQNVEIRDGRFFSTAPTPWLRLDCDAAALAGRWVELTFVTGLLEPLARPLLRCVGTGGVTDRLLPGALFGKALWVGAIPAGTKELYVSPTNRAGRFDFAITGLSVLPTLARLTRVARRDPWRLAKALIAELLGRRFMAEIHFRRALSTTCLKNYESWRKARLRPFDAEGLDAPSLGWGGGPHLRFVVDARRRSPLTLTGLAADLQGQPYLDWSLAILCAPGEAAALRTRAAFADARTRFIDDAAPLAELTGDLAARDFIAPLAAEDRMADYAPAALAEAAHREPDAALIYGDEDFIDAGLRRHSPRLRGGWDEVLFAHQPDLGGAVFFRIDAVARLDPTLTVAALLTAPERVSASIVADGGQVHHLKRVMRSRAQAKESWTPAPLGAPPLPRPVDWAIAGRPAATIIIPTRDQAAMLRRCVASLNEATPPRAVEIVIVDNGGARADSKRLLAELAGQPNIRLLSMPGPFNFAALCNRAAQTARAQTLIFLNDDTQILGEDWLGALLRWTRRADVGAVGAKLLYPGGTVQHAGVILGIDGRAGHFERALPARHPGYFGRLGAPHQVSAVTGACLAVEKRKFDAVGGFDADNLPVELGDVDLCLRLAERGWKCVLAADCLALHHESLSRRPASRPDQRYAKEIGYFQSKWGERLRDDPHFHPALSLDSLQAAL